MFGPLKCLTYLNINKFVCEKLFKQIIVVDCEFMDLF